MTQNIAPSEYVKQIMSAGNMEEKAALVLYMRCVRSAKAAGHDSAGPAALASDPATFASKAEVAPQPLIVIEIVLALFPRH